MNKAWTRSVFEIHVSSVILTKSRCVRQRVPYYGLGYHNNGGLN